jgi:hypothetical protein
VTNALAYSKAILIFAVRKQLLSRTNEFINDYTKVKYMNITTIYNEYYLYKMEIIYKRLLKFQA